MDTVTVNSFFNEIEKIAQEARSIPDNQITSERFKRFLGAAIPGAIGSGIGFGVGGLVGRPIERKLLELGFHKGPSKVLRYALPTVAGLGAALAASRADLRNQLFKRVKGGDNKRDISTERQPG